MIFDRIFKRRRRNARPFARLGSTTPGIRLGRYASGLDAVWAWETRAHLLMVETWDYGAGENLVRRVFRTHIGPKVCLDPKGYRDDSDPEIAGTMESCLIAFGTLKAGVHERMDAIEAGKNVAHLLVAIPELHDITEFLHPKDEVAKQFLIDLAYLLKVGRAARIHVLANTRQGGSVYRLRLPGEIRHQFTGLLVLGKTTDAVTKQLDLPQVFATPHGLLGDLDEGFWPLEVRRR